MTMRTTVGRLLAVLLLLGLLAGCTGGGAAEEDAGDEPALGGGSEDPAEVAGVESEEESEPATGGGEVLARVQDAGQLVCGVNDGLPGFGILTAEGDFEGFDVDFCRAVAAAVLGDPGAVEFRPLSADERFPALSSGEVDLLSRNTTWTATRDGENGARFLTTTFYDGQGMMVRADSGFTAVDDLTDTTICVTSGTTTELNLASRFTGIPYEPLVLPDNEAIQTAFIEQRCDGWTSDTSQLASVRSAFPAEQGGPESLVILDEVFSKEPLGPAVADGDDQWAQVVDWVVHSLVQAEEYGITQANVEQQAAGEDPAIRQFLGQPGGEDDAVLDPGLGLEPDFAVDVITAVGNYGEIFERNITPLGVERGLNALWTDGGLHYAPPYR
jgi:general L-amino acid transport system substrate-binding protein